MDTKQKQTYAKSSCSAPHVEAQADDQGLKDRILRNLVALPSMPHVVTQALRIIAAEDPSLQELASVIETDPAIAAKILKMANSAYYGLSGRISSLQKAAVLLGTRQLTDVIIMAGISTLLENKLEGYGLESGELWRHSLAAAFGSKIISKKTTPHLTDDAFAAGLLHDIGKVALDRYIFEKKSVFDEFLKDGRHSFTEAEIQILGVDHSEIAWEICTNWRIPETLCSAIRYCLCPSQSNGNELAYIVHMADILAERSEIRAGTNDRMPEFEDGAAEFLGLAPEHLEDITAEMMEATENTIEAVSKG